jgi:hypothetical protein
VGSTEKGKGKKINDSIKPSAKGKTYGVLCKGEGGEETKESERLHEGRR